MPPIHPDHTLGVALIGVVVASAYALFFFSACFSFTFSLSPRRFYGISVVQTHYYYTHQKDNWSVCTSDLLPSLHRLNEQSLSLRYSLCLCNLVLGRIFDAQSTCLGFTALLVQSFLTMRVWKCETFFGSQEIVLTVTPLPVSNRRIWLTGLLVLLVAGEFGCVVAFTVLSLQLQTYGELAHLEPLSIAVNALAAAGDLLIAASLCIILHQSRTGFQRSDTMIKKLIVYSVNTGLLTSLCAVASLISIVLAGHTFLYIMFFFCIGRLYSNSLLATLNARKKIRAAADNIQNTSENLSLSLREFPRSGGISMATKRPTNISIKIDTTKEFNTDLIHECDRDDDRSVRQGLDEKRNEIGMTFARKASSSTTTTFAESPIAQML
ncbi:hypothetical protein NP233_g2169 [Leucocoprinus birnbaumii]|uniref:DUF6534 domain-containing protein n=1 Tax=Leucocoprinus birnbaumii TaxID=56174 RepID=A0AAD5YV50_9AGAR|nr:hypothetical protein NP233_g2169 [Leucocoprinus birnbaumii]